MMLNESVVKKKNSFLYRYRYEKYSPFSNSTLSLSPCLLESDSQLPQSIIEKSQSKRNDGKMPFFYLINKGFFVCLFVCFFTKTLYGLYYGQTFKCDFFFCQKVYLN